MRRRARHTTVRRRLLPAADTAVLGVTTTNDFDGIWFETAPGATVRVTAALGQALYAENFFWTSAGAVRSDAGSNPLEFTPTAP